MNSKESDVVDLIDLIMIGLGFVLFFYGLYLLARYFQGWGISGDLPIDGGGYNKLRLLKPERKLRISQFSKIYLLFCSVLLILVGILCVYIFNSR